MFSQVFRVAIATVMVMTTASVFAKEPVTIYDIPVKPMSGADGRTSATTLKPYRGKVLLIVNVASKCGFTKQYAQLEQIYRKYRGQGLEILAFPCNQFGGQEPGSEQDIVEFCTSKYSVTFPIFAKVDVKGESAAPLFKYLTEGNHPAASSISWNFNKFLIGRDGKPIAHFGSMVRPDSKEMVEAIEAALAAK
jgi:glutathione peroxidase